jgi:exodeoxyribonuclease III
LGAADLADVPYDKADRLRDGTLDACDSSALRDCTGVHHPGDVHRAGGSSRSATGHHSGVDDDGSLSPTAAKQAERLARREAALAARSSMSPTEPAPDRLRVASWNVNSLKVRTDAVERLLERTGTDILCLQETRAAVVSEPAAALFHRLGYHVVHAGTGSSGGVAIVARHEMSDVRSSGQYGNEHLDREPRITSGVVHADEPIRVASVYVPHGRSVGHWHYDYKLAFLTALTEQVRAWLADGTRLVLAGDVNVAPTDSDVFHPDAFAGSTHVTPPERGALSGLLDVGLVDTDAACWGAHARRFTWWNHGIGYPRNLGMRIDMIAVDTTLAARLDTTWIDHVERGGERPSDHAALIADFHGADPPA